VPSHLAISSHTGVPVIEAASAIFAIYAFCGTPRMFFPRSRKSAFDLLDGVIGEIRSEEQLRIFGSRSVVIFQAPQPGRYAQVFQKRSSRLAIATMSTEQRNDVFAVGTCDSQRHLPAHSFRRVTPMATHPSLAASRYSQNSAWISLYVSSR